MQELVTLIEESKILGKLTNNQKNQLISMAVRRILKRNEMLYMQGELWTNVLLIAAGKLRSVINTMDGRSFIVTTWEKRDEFWPHTLFDGNPMPSNLEAVQESIIYQWDGETVLRTVLDNREAARALMSRLITLVRKRRETIYELAFQPVTGRLAKLLLDQIPASEPSGQRDLTLPQIASMVASSPEVVCRSLYQLQRFGLLQVTRASITLHDRAGLERLIGIE
jgi:CRP-like cAMP-binding protein